MVPTFGLAGNPSAPHRTARRDVMTQSLRPGVSPCPRMRRSGRLPARGYEYAGENQRKADDVEKLRTLAEEEDGHHRAEYGHDVKEGGGAVGADQLYAAVEAEIGECRGKHCDIEQRQHVRGIDRNRRACEYFPDPERKEVGRAAAEG